MRIARAEIFGPAKPTSEAGRVMVNLPTAGVDDHVPLGSRKGSRCGPGEQGCAREFYATAGTSRVFA